MNHLDPLGPETHRDRSNTSIAAAVVLMAASLLFAVTPLYAGAAQTYSQDCSACHGANGKGDGPASQMINPKPSDFAVALKDKGDDWIAKVIREGGRGVGKSPVMPSYHMLSRRQVKALAAYVKKLGS